MSGWPYFPRSMNLSIMDISSAISYWLTVAKVSWNFCSAPSSPVMSRILGARKLRYIHTKNFYKELDNFVSEMKRRKINLFCFIFWKGKRAKLRKNATSEWRVCFRLPRWIPKIKFYWDSVGLEGLLCDVINGISPSIRSQCPPKIEKNLTSLQLFSKE